MLQRSNSLLNVRDVTDYLYCKRKVYLRKIKGSREKLNSRMVAGKIRHGVFDELNKKEEEIVCSISEKISMEEIGEIYKKNILGITKRLFDDNSASSAFGMNFWEFWNDSWASFKVEIQPRIKAVSKFLEKGIFGKELWEKLEPKYLTELRIVSEKLNIIGRIDRIQILTGGEKTKYIPFELKSGSVKEPYESDLIQLASYALLLEGEFDTVVEKGFVEYRNKKIPIEITAELKERVLGIIEEISKFSLDSMPPINSNFNKCKNCGLKEECFAV